MGNNAKRYKQMEFYMTASLIADLVLLILYFIAAGNGIIWLKIILAIITIILSGLCLAYLYLSQELLRQRSLWMTVSAGSVLICLIISLLLNFPCPNPYKGEPTEPETQASFSTQYFL